MDIIRDIAIRLKDRIIVLDRDILDRKVDVSKNSEIYKTFHRLKGRHYKLLKQGPGWSFPITALEEMLGVPPSPPPAPVLQAPPPAPVLQEPSQALPAPTPAPSQAPPRAPVREQSKAKTKDHAYEADIPNEVRLYFKKYEALIFS